MSLVFRGSREELVRVLRELVAAISGTGFDPESVSRPILTRGAIALLSKIQQAFIVKARGGTGSDGIKWAPLTRATIAGRRTTAAERRQLGIGGRRVRGLLTPSEDRQWRRIFASRLAHFRARGVSESEAKGIAARIAWAVLKAAGAKTRLEVLGGRVVEILRDTGELFNSLTAGYEETPANPEGQILEIGPGQIAAGTWIKPWHHHGVPGRFPARPFWPTDGNLPQEWWNAILAAMIRGLIQAISQAVSRHG